MKYSIVIPHFELPECLDRLISTIPVREDIEIIVIDDCSGKETCQKLENLHNRYPKVRFFSTPQNGGGGCARNIGIREAKGDYLIFADADDYFLPSFNTLLTENLAFSGDILFFNAISLDTLSYLPMKRANQLNAWMKNLNDGKDKLLLNLQYLFGEPWCKMIKRELVIANKIYFDEIKVHNDTYFSYKVGFHAKKIKVEDIACYVVTDRQGSVSKNVKWEKWALRTEVFAKKNRFFEENGIKLFDSMLLTSFWECLCRRNFGELRRNLDIAQRYGYSQQKIWWKIINWKIDNFFKNLNK